MINYYLNGSHSFTKRANFGRLNENSTVKCSQMVEFIDIVKTVKPVPTQTAFAQIVKYFKGDNVNQT